MGAAAEAEREFLTVQRALEPMAAVMVGEMLQHRPVYQIAAAAAAGLVMMHKRLVHLAAQVWSYSDSPHQLFLSVSATVPLAMEKPLQSQRLGAMAQAL